MGKPIAGRNKSPFGIAGINVDAAVLSDGTKLTNVRISKQRSINVFDLISADGATVYPFVKITGVDINGASLNPASGASALADVLPAGTFCISIVDTDQNVIGFAVRLLQNKVILQNGSAVFLSDYAGQAIVIPEVIHVTGVTLAPATVSLSLAGTKTAQLTPTVAPANADVKTVTYASSDTSVATVSASGLVTAVAVGTATITVTTTDGSKTATSAVTVAE